MDITEQIPTEEQTISDLLATLHDALAQYLHPDDDRQVREILEEAREQKAHQSNVFHLNPMLFGLQTAQIAMEEIGLRREGVLAIILTMIF